MAARSKIARAAAWGALALASLAPALCWGAVAAPAPLGLPFEKPNATNNDGAVVGVNAVIKRGMQVLAGLSVLAIIWAGITYVTSYGDEDKTKKAKKITIWVVVGLVASMAGWAIIDIVNSVSLQPK